MPPVSNYGVGLANASIYNPFVGTPSGDTWTTLPLMNAGRWYPTATVLANGDVLVVAGGIDNTVGANTLPQVFEVGNLRWRNLTSAELFMNGYPQMFLAPNGKVFNSGETTTTRYLDTAGTGAWTVVANRVGPNRDYGSAVMYAPGKILVMGGGDPPTNTAEVIDLTQSSPSRTAPSGRCSLPGVSGLERRCPTALCSLLVAPARPAFNNPAGAGPCGRAMGSSKPDAVDNARQQLGHPSR